MEAPWRLLWGAFLLAIPGQRQAPRSALPPQPQQCGLSGQNQLRWQLPPSRSAPAQGNSHTATVGNFLAHQRAVWAASSDLTVAMALTSQWGSPGLSRAGRPRGLPWGKTAAALPGSGSPCLWAPPNPATLPCRAAAWPGLACRGGFQLSRASPGNQRGRWKGGFALAPCFRRRFSPCNRFVRQGEKPGSPDALSGAQRHVLVNKDRFVSRPC